MWLKWFLNGETLSKRITTSDRMYLSEFSNGITYQYRARWAYYSLTPVQIYIHENTSMNRALEVVSNNVNELFHPSNKLSKKELYAVRALFYDLIGDKNNTLKWVSEHNPELYSALYKLQVRQPLVSKLSVIRNYLHDYQVVSCEILDDSPARLVFSSTW